MEYETHMMLAWEFFGAQHQTGARVVNRIETKDGLSVHTPRSRHYVHTGLCHTGCGTKTAVKCQNCFEWVCLDHKAQCVWCHDAFCLPCYNADEEEDVYFGSDEKDVCGSCAARQRKSMLCFFCRKDAKHVARKQGCSVADLIELACADLNKDPDHKSALLVVCHNNDEKKAKLALYPHTCAVCGKCQCNMYGWLRIPGKTFDKTVVVCDIGGCLKKLQMQTLMLGLT